MSERTRVTPSRTLSPSREEMDPLASSASATSEALSAQRSARNTRRTSSRWLMVAPKAGELTLPRAQASELEVTDELTALKRKVVQQFRASSAKTLDTSVANKRVLEVRAAACARPARAHLLIMAAARAGRRAGRRPPPRMTTGAQRPPTRRR